jgi:hypothetical protein
MKPIFLLLFATTAASATASFQFDSFGGAFSGTPGSTIGWGFTITDSTEYVFVSQTAFCFSASQPSDLANCGTQVASDGTYTDFSGNIPVVGPAPDAPSLTEHYNFLNQTGYGSFQILNSVSPGTVLTGEIAIVYDLFTGDPETDPNATQIGGDNFTSLPATITVASSVPEPAPTFLIGAGMVFLSLVRSKLR